MKVLSFDIGGTNLRGALIDGEYNVIKIKKIPTPHSGNDDLIAAIVSMVNELSEGHSDILDIVFGVPGRVDKHSYFIDELPNVGVTNLDIKKEINLVFPYLRVFIYNDAEMAALYEASEGSGKKFKRVYYITISTGLGGCLMVNKVWTPASYEVGHTLFEYRGEYEELEHIASGSGLVKLAKLNGLEIRSSKAFFEGLRLSVPEYVNVFEEWMKILTRFFTMLHDLWKPQVIVIGGGVAFQSSLFLSAIRERNPFMKFVISSQIDDAGLFGCVTLVKLVNENHNPFEGY